MTRRAGQWDLLGHAADPVPASEWDVQQAAGQFDDRAGDLEEAHSTLSRLSRLDGWRGRAAETFGEKADDVLGDLDKAQRKYAEAGAALRSFAGSVDIARTRSWNALTDAVAADTAMRQNRPDPLDGVADPSPEMAAAAAAESDRHAAAVTALGDARTALANALDDLEQAARTCADAVDDASAVFKDSRWDDVKGAVRSIAGILVTICDVLEWVALGLAAVALAIAIFATAPIWGTVAAIVFAVGVVVAAAILVIRSSLVLSESGDASWADVGWDGVGLLASAIGGRATVRALREVPGLISGGAAAGRTAVTATARTNLPQNGRNALNIADDANPLRVWAQREWDALAAPGRSAIDTAQSTTATWAERLRVLDTDAATNLARIRALQALGHPQMADDLARALQLQMSSVNLNLLNTGLSVDQLMDQFDVSLSGIGKDAAEDIAQHLENLHWRVTVAGR